MLILLGALFLSSATLVAAQTEGISTERPYTGPTGSTGRPYTGPTGSTGLPYYGSTGNTGRPYTGPTGSTGLPFTGPTGSTGRPYTGPTGSTVLPFTGPTGSTRFPYSGPTSSTGLPYYGSTGSTGRPYTGPTGSTGLPATGRTSAAPVTAAPVTDTDNYCKCGIVDGWFDDWDPSTIWVDVIIILDTSKSMGESLEEAKSVITSFVGLMSTDVSAEFYSRIGVIAMSDTIEVIYNLNMTSSDNLDSVHQNKIDKIDVGDAFQAALQMFADGTKLPSYRANAVQLIYYLTNSAP